MSKMSKSFVPLAVSSSDDDESKKSSPKSIRQKGVANKNSNNSSSSSIIIKNHNSQADSWNISPMPTPKSIKHNNNRAMMMYGQLTPAGRSMTPTCQGRIKAPPVCSAPALQKVASDVSEFTYDKVCFSFEEAESCAAKVRHWWNKNKNNQHLQHHPQHPLRGGGDVDDNVPLNIDGIGEYWKIHAESAAAAAEVKAYVSSNSTVVTHGSASVATATAAGGTTPPLMKKDRPPLEVVRTSNENSFVVHSEYEHTTNHAPPAASAHADVVATASAVTSNSSSTLPLSRDFTDKLVKGNSSRQGRSLQRWLVHSQTEELVRQVAGTVPITRDGRIVLVSASRKNEWILPKGGWDADETREECAARETFEEAGLLGRLGACMEPIDYETSKAKTRRLSVMLGEGGEEGGGVNEGRGARMPLPKRVKKIGRDGGSLYSPTGPDLTEDGVAAKSRPNLASDSSLAAPSNSDTKNYSYVRLSLFPMYISEVKNNWPEKGRLRKIVDIDEAIKIMEKEDRGYFKRGLEMIKDRGLHLLRPDSK